MPVETFTYVELASRLGTSPEAARALVKRHRIPRSRSNDGRTLVSVDVAELRHTPLPARSPRGHHPITDQLAILKARIGSLEAELAAEQQRSAGHRLDYERERDRGDRMVTGQNRLIAELENLRGFLAAALAGDQVVTSRTRRIWRWMRSSAG